MLVVQHLVFLLCVVVPRADFALSRDVRATLTQLRLSQYASAFEDAEIVAGDLPLLSEEDLAEMGLPRAARARVLREFGESEGGGTELPASDDADDAARPHSTATSSADAASTLVAPPDRSPLLRLHGAVGVARQLP